MGRVILRGVSAISLAVIASGCVARERVTFQPRAQQEALVRDGNQAIVSRKRSSIVIVRPAAREFQSGARPVFVVGINNQSNAAQQFRVADVQVVQNVGASAVALKVITFEDLQTEERNRQVAAAVLTVLAVGANSVAASRQGYYNANSTVYTPRGVYNVQTTGYSPVAAAIAQDRAAGQNEALVAATIERGQQNMAVLEQSVIKDNTLLPGEWYGGQLHISPPSSDGGSGGPKTYIVSLMVGADRHDVEVVQSALR